MGSSILLSGTQDDNIYIIWDGAVEVRVSRTDPETQEHQSVWFENLSRGACINVYAAFTDKMTSLVDFYALTKKTIICKISVGDLYNLAKKRQLLKDKLQILEERIRNEMIDSLDYFTCLKKYIQLDTYDSFFSEREKDSRIKLKKKFRKTMMKFKKKFEKGQVEYPKACLLLSKIKKDRI